MIATTIILVMDKTINLKLLINGNNIELNNNNIIIFDLSHVYYNFKYETNVKIIILVMNNNHNDL